MNPLTKEQALKISELHHKWKAAHPNATREDLARAVIKIKHKVLNSTKK